MIRGDANRSSHVTPLHFIPAGLGGRRARSLGGVGGGWRLNGNLHTLGYFFTLGDSRDGANVFDATVGTRTDENLVNLDVG